jgi:CO dehydrogenase/acetyl-CoA synthase alpha subunit
VKVKVARHLVVVAISVTRADIDLKLVFMGIIDVAKGRPCIAVIGWLSNSFVHIIYRFLKNQYIKSKSRYLPDPVSFFHDNS